MPPSQEPAGHRYALPSGSRVGDYRIEGFLGAGSFGITYLATDERLGRRVAIKEYLPSDWAIRDADGSVAAKTQSDAEDLRWGLERFAEEARALARFDHPNVVRVHRYFTAHDTGFLVMEYVDGGSLGEMLRRKGTLTEEEIERHVLPVLDGLEQLHEAGLLHRDIKPDNIALRADGSPVLVDFGAARQEVGARSRALTSLVTPRYSPLEQYSTNATQGPATDLYAFAAVLYRCVTGHPPLDAADRSLGEEQVPASEAAKGAHGGELLASIDAALSPKIAERPQSVERFRTLLLSDMGKSSTKEEVRTEESPRDSATPSSGVSGRRSKRPSAMPLDKRHLWAWPLVTVSIASAPQAIHDFAASLFAGALWFLLVWGAFAAIDRIAVLVRVAVTWLLRVVGHNSPHWPTVHYRIAVLTAILPLSMLHAGLQVGNPRSDWCAETPPWSDPHSRQFQPSGLGEHFSEGITAGAARASATFHHLRAIAAQAQGHNAQPYLVTMRLVSEEACGVMHLEALDFSTNRVALSFGGIMPILLPSLLGGSVVALTAGLLWFRKPRRKELRDAGTAVLGLVCGLAVLAFGIF